MNNRIVAIVKHVASMLPHMPHMLYNYCLLYKNATAYHLGRYKPLSPPFLSQILVFLNGPIPASFCLFLFFSHYNFNTIWKKHRWCAWDSNPGPQDGWRRRNHRAMAATKNVFLHGLNSWIAYWWGRYGCSSPSTKVLHAPTHAHKQLHLLGQWLWLRW